MFCILIIQTLCEKEIDWLMYVNRTKGATREGAKGAEAPPLSKSKLTKKD